MRRQRHVQSWGAGDADEYRAHEAPLGLRGQEGTTAWQPASGGPRVPGKGLGKGSGKKREARGQGRPHKWL